MEDVERKPVPQSISSLCENSQFRRLFSNQKSLPVTSVISGGLKLEHGMYVKAACLDVRHAFYSHLTEKLSG